MSRRARYQGSAAWHDERRTGLGSSDAPIVAGVSPWGDPDEQLRTLWAEKRGLAAPTVTTEVMAWGHRLEAVVADAYAEQEGVTLRRVDRPRRHPRLPFMLASVDRRVTGGDRRLVEVKTTASRTPEWGQERTAEVPEHVLVQVQHQLAVTGAPVSDVAVLFLRERHLGVYTVERDGTLISRLEATEEAFWARVQAGIPPDPLANTRGPLPLRTGEIEADPETTALVGDLFTVRAQLEQLEARKEELEAALKPRIEHAERVRGAGFRITYKPTADRVRTDWKLVAGAYRRLIEDYGLDVNLAQLQALLPEGLDGIEGLFTTTAPGIRPLRLSTTKEVAA